ncbi:MAG: BolA family protein [Mariprofundales bacterium]
MNERASVIASIETRLRAQLCPSRLELVDDSAQHAGHRQHATHGGGHFCLTVAADCFSGHGRAACHRMVYQALEGMFSDDIHAFTIRIVDA